MEDISRFIAEQFLFLLPVLWIVGMLLKNSKIQDWLIPWVILIVSIIFVMGFGGISWNNFFQGILLAGAAVYGHQLYKQTSIKDAPVFQAKKDGPYKL